jgi:ABC-type uncharacterized transport system substrate-binding protein
MRHFRLGFFFLTIWLFLVVAPSQLAAHPHAFVEAFVSFVFDEEGLKGVRQRWLLDEMLSTSILDLTAENHDGRLDEKEIAAVKQKGFDNLKGYNFFTHIHIDGQRFEAAWATEFKASLEGGKLVYSFFIPCHVKAHRGFKKVDVAVYDESFYAYVAYGTEEGSGLDPTADPLFANPNAPAKPDDFARFSQAVGIGSYTGGVRVEGPAQQLAIKAEVVEIPERAYFYEQIVPEAFVVRFKRK